MKGPTLNKFLKILCDPLLSKKSYLIKYAAQWGRGESAFVNFCSVPLAVIGLGVRCAPPTSVADTVLSKKTSCWSKHCWVDMNLLDHLGNN